MQINYTFDSSVSSAPAGFTSAIAYVINLYDTLFTNNTTITINIGWGEVAGQSLDANSLGENSSYYYPGYTYSDVANALKETGTGANQLTAFASLPANDPTGGESFNVNVAEAINLGLTNTRSSAGSVGFASGQNYDFTPNTTPSGNSYDFVAVFEHELSEVLGRTSDIDTGGTASPMDLFRFSAPGVRDFTAAPPSPYKVAYFSTNGGVTDLDNWNPKESVGDLGDWAQSAGNDSFDAVSSPGVINYLTTTDVDNMNILGWNTAYNPLTTVQNGVAMLNQTVSSGMTETVMSGGQMVGGSIVSGGTVILQAGATESGAYVNSGGTLVVQMGAVVSGLYIEDGAIIDIAGVSGATAKLDGAGHLLISSGGSVVETLGIYDGASLYYTPTSDGSGGTDIFASATNTGFSGTAAQVSAQIDSLNSNSSVNRITITDNAAVTLSVAQHASDTRAISLLANANGSAVQLSVKDTGAAIGGAFNALNSDASISSIVITDSKPAPISTAQLTTDATAIGKLSFSGSATAGTVKIVDTGANVATALDSLNGNARVASIVVSDNASIAVNAGQVGSDATAIGKLVNANASAAKLAVSDTGTNIAADLASLAGQPLVSSIVVTDGVQVRVTAAQVSAYASTLAKLSFTGGATAGTLKVQDTAANLSAVFDALNGNPMVGKISVLDNAALNLTVAQLQNDTTALGKAKTYSAGAVTVKVVDTAANISAALASLNGNAMVSAIAISDGARIKVSVAQISSDATAIGKLSYASGSTGGTLKVQDTAANLVAALDALNGNAKVGAISVLDNNPLVVTAAQGANDTTALGLAKTFSGAPLVVTVSDTAANITAALAGLNASPALTSIQISDGAVVRVTVAQIPAYATALAKLEGPGGSSVGTLKVQDTEAHISGAFDYLNGDAEIGKISMSDSTPLTLSAAQAANDATALNETKSYNGDPLKLVLLDTTAHFNGATIGRFTISGDAMDITDLASASLTASFTENSAGTAGTLSLTDGTHSASITLLGQFMAAGFSGTAAAAGFNAVTDGVSGTAITYTAVSHGP